MRTLPRCRPQRGSADSQELQGRNTRIERQQPGRWNLSQGFWRTAITNVEPNRIQVRGYDIQSLIREGSFGDVVYLLFKGEWPLRGEGRLVEAILVSSCDHGLAAPTANATRFVASCGVSLPAAVAAGLLGIGEHHAGAIEGCARAFLEALPASENDLAAAADRLVASARSKKERLLGFGHPIHREDPRVAPLVEIAEQLGLTTRWVAFAREVERALREQTGRPLPINVDGIIAALMLEMDLDWRLGKALFLLSRAAGLSAHYFEQTTAEKPFKAVPPKEIDYEGPESRSLPETPKPPEY